MQLIALETRLQDWEAGEYLEKLFKGGGGDTPLRPGSSSKTHFGTGAYRGVQGQIA